jgi:hypothetical protein
LQQRLLSGGIVLVHMLPRLDMPISSSAVGSLAAATFTPTAVSSTSFSPTAVSSTSAAACSYYWRQLLREWLLAKQNCWR